MENNRPPRSPTNELRMVCTWPRMLICEPRGSSLFDALMIASIFLFTLARSVSTTLP
jgi:hypothetical protein